MTFTAAVPTVWLMLLQYLQKNSLRLSTLEMVGIGGSACPPEMIRAFEDESQPYASLVLPMWQNRYGSYDDLARIKEWSAAGGLGLEEW